MALVAYGVPADVRLVTVIVIGAATYLGLINWRAPEVVTEAQSLIPMSRWLRLRRAAGPSSSARPSSGGTNQARFAFNVRTNGTRSAMRLTRSRRFWRLSVYAQNASFSGGIGE